MILHPEAQRLAQQEIDSVVGIDRLPDFYDRPSLKYVEAVFRETIRWHIVAPLGEGLDVSTMPFSLFRQVFLMQHQVMTSSEAISFQKVSRLILSVGGFILCLHPY
jgi:cytochrome P450